MQLSSFEQDILSGLQQHPKLLPSKYFYDATGDVLFQQIMELPDYYLTRCEMQIFEHQKQAFLEQFCAGNQPFELIELGAGDGLKTKVLLNHFSSQKADFTYVPIDISEHAVNNLSIDIQKELPQVKINPLCSDYFLGLEALKQHTNTRKVVLFLGSSIGNIPDRDAIEFLKQLGNNLTPGDMLLTGFDLRKEPSQILAAYNDAEGVTRNFNLNLINRINKETGSNINPDQFLHYPIYEPLAGEARSYLVSKTTQQIYFPNSKTTIQIAAWEAILTEIARKYTLGLIASFAEEAGFSVMQHYTDVDCQFTDSLWVKN